MAADASRQRIAETQQSIERNNAAIRENEKHLQQHRAGAGQQAQPNVG